MPAESLSAWRRDNGDAILRLEYPLSSTSIVVDAGGFKGQWASDIHSRYGCFVHIFEPIDEFSEYIRWRFEHNPKVQIHRLGLANEDSVRMFGIAGDRTGAHNESGRQVQVNLVAAVPYLLRLGLHDVDLMKINIEGGEYDLLNHLSETNYMQHITFIQVQFHNFFTDSDELRNEARRRLSLTHEVDYEYPFVWESWRRRNK